MSISNNQSVVLFDGVCNFCDQSVQFIIQRDALGKFKFASLQSETGQILLERYGLNKHKAIDTVVLIQDGKAYIKSKAALKIVAQLESPFRFLSIFRIVPTFISDFFYDIFAANRYRFFGKKEHCMIPSAEQRARFLS